MVKCLHMATVLLLALVNTISWAAKPAKNTVPTVSITSPASGATFTAPATITVTATASDSDGTVQKVDFYQTTSQGTALIGSKASAPYTINWSGVSPGTYSLTAKATDNAGGVGTSAAVSVTVGGASSVIISSPANGAVVTAPNASVTGTYQGDSTTTSVWINNGNSTRLAVLSGSNFSATIPIFLGANTISVSVVRQDKTTDSASITIYGSEEPKIAFTSPTSSSTFIQPASIELAVDAVSPGSSIKNVVFLNGSAPLATISQPPYQYTWNNVQKGQYSITAQAIDNLGISSSTSTLISVLGPNVPPTVSLTAPANNSTFGAGETVTLTADAADSDGTIKQVDFLLNGSYLSSTNVPPYKFEWQNVPLGSHALAARATDNSGAQTVSSSVAISVITAPSVTLSTSTSSNKIAAGSSVTLSADASSVNGIKRVDFYQGSNLLGSASASPYAFVWKDIPVGSYSLTAKAIDNLGAGGTSAVTSMEVVPGAKVTIADPVNDSSFAALATIPVSVFVADSPRPIASVGIYEGSNFLGSATTLGGPYTFTWKNVKAGTYSLTAQATDDQGLVSTSAPVTVTVSGPSIRITSPMAGDTINSDHVLVTGMIDAHKYSGVTVNGVIAIVDSNGAFYANDVPLVPDSNILTATVTTPDELTASADVTVTRGTDGSSHMHVDNVEGVAGLDAKFTIENANGIKQVDFYAMGNASQVDYSTASDPNFTVGTTTISATFSYASVDWLYKPYVIVTDMQGNVTRHEAVLKVHHPRNMNQMLGSLWDRMVGNLKAEDIPVSLTSIVTGARDKYRMVFQSAQPDLPTAANKLGTLQPYSFELGMAEYLLVRTTDGVDYAYPVYFVRDADGVWRIGSM